VELIDEDDSGANSEDIVSKTIDKKNKKSKVDNYRLALWQEFKVK
jgi:hypothetical protein